MRLCHLLLHSCFNNPAPAVSIAVGAANGMAAFELTFQAGPADSALRGTPLSAEDLRVIVETAGGALVAASDAALSMTFMRVSDPPPG
jgi:hypothetical protein